MLMSPHIVAALGAIVNAPPDGFVQFFTNFFSALMSALSVHSIRLYNVRGMRTPSRFGVRNIARKPPTVAAD